MSEYKKGQTVNIINSTMSGVFFVEGQATIVRKLVSGDSLYQVRFGHERGTVTRFVDPLAQSGDVGRYVAKLNDPGGSSLA